MWILTDLAWTSCLLGVLFFVGRGLVERLGVTADLDGPLVPLGIGITVAGLVLFGLAAARLLLFAPLLVLVTLGFALLRLSRHLRERRAAPDDNPSAVPAPPPWVRVAGGVLAVATIATLVVLWLQALRPDVAWDSNVYHLRLPKLYNELGGFRHVPFNVYSSWPHAMELLFAVGMQVGTHVTAKLLHYACGVAVVLTLLGSASSVRSAEARASSLRWLAPALFLASPVVLYEMRIAYIDVALALLLLGAFLALHRAIEREKEEPNVAFRLHVVSGILAGGAATLKLSGFFVGLALIGSYVVSSTLRRQRFLATIKISLALGIPTLVLLAPWLGRNELLVGNPVFPLLYGVFGGDGWSQQLAQQHSEWQREIGQGRGLVDYVLLPLRVLVAGGPGYANFDGQLHLLWLPLLPLAGLHARRDALTRRALGVAGIYFLLWAATSQQMRFLIPILPLLALAATRAVVALELPRKARQASSAVLCVAAAVLLTLGASVYARQSPSIARALAVDPQIHERIVHPTYRFINEELPEDTTVLLLNTNHSFFIDREVIADSFFEASQIVDAFQGLSAAQARALMDGLGIGHILIRGGSTGLPYPAGLRTIVDNPSLCRPLHRSPDGAFTLCGLVRG